MLMHCRGAGESPGRTTWTGKAELQDYISFTGFLIYYLHTLAKQADEERAVSVTVQVHLILGGYSYGSLILARFPPTTEIVQRFEKAEVGTAAAEIILRARTLAKQTQNALAEQQSSTSPRGRATLKPVSSPTSPSKRVSPMTVGGEETDPSDRRRSRDSRRSVDVIRKSVDVPHRIKAHMKRRHSSHEQPEIHGAAPAIPKAPLPAAGMQHVPEVVTSYLLISPVLLPFSTNLMPPGAPTSGPNVGRGDTDSTKQFLQHPTLVLFGSHDAFTSSKRLRQWAEKQAGESHSDFRPCEIDHAGHFWSEEGVLRALQGKLADWIHGLSRDGSQDSAAVG